MANDPIDTLRRTAYPNPERKGCPDAATFDALRSRRIAFDDPVWKHIEHCSPCYCEFAEIRESLFEEERKSDSRRLMRASLLIIALVLVASGLYLWRRSTNDHKTMIAANHREAAVLNFEDASELRSARANAPRSANSGVQHLPRNDLSLTVYLPLGSPVGEYQLEILNAADQIVWHTDGQASIRDGLTSVPVAGDLRGVPSGEYRFRFRRPSESWHEKPLLIE